MDNQSESSYVKYVYWLTEGEESRLRKDLRSRSIRLKSAKGIVCTPLREKDRISSVAPEVWNDTCARQGSWYRASDKNSLYLVISSFELEDIGLQKAATITQSEFDPPRLAGGAEKERMVNDPVFADRIPQDWKKIDKRDKRIYLRWAKRFGSEVNDYNFLYLSHTANHANFIKPQLFIEENRTIIPYSIDRSAHLCSCCLELFQVVGAQHPRKLVAPCPGAAIFAGLEADRYLLVENDDPDCL